MSGAAATALALLLVLVLAPVGQASHPEPAPPLGSVWTVYTTVEASVVDNYATVSIIADIGNRGPDPEFPFQVRVPADAFVTGFSIERDGTMWEGRIEDRDAAREEYEEQKAGENTAGLIEKKRGTQVYAFLINVAEFESVQAIMTYEMYLPAHQDVYSLALEAPVSGFGEDLGASFDVSVCHSAGVDSVTTAPASSLSQDGDCRTARHNVGARHNEAATPLAVHYAIPPTGDEGSIQSIVIDGVGYFAHPFRAAPDARQLPLDLVLVLDTSGSMGQENKMSQMKDAAGQVLGRLDDADRLAIVEFNSGTFTSMGDLETASASRVADGRQLVNEFFAGGSTNIEAGLRDGFGAYDGTSACSVAAPAPAPCLEPRSRILVFLTDGQATVGISSRDGLRDLAADLNPGDVRMFALAFGSGADYPLVAGLAKDNSGSALLVPQGEGAEVDLRRFMAALATPVLQNVVVDYNGDVQAYRNQADVLFQGSELLVVGTFDGALERMSGTVSGESASGPRSYEFDAAVGGGSDRLQRIAAYAQIQHFHQLIAADGEQADWVSAIKEIALKWKFVTDYTSLLINTQDDVPVRSWSPEEARSAESDAATGASAPSTSPPSTTPPPRTPGTPVSSPTSPPTPSAEGSSDEDTQTPGFGLALILVVLGTLGVLRRRTN